VAVRQSADTSSAARRAAPSSRAPPSGRCSCPGGRGACVTCQAGSADRTCHSCCPGAAQPPHHPAGNELPFTLTSTVPLRKRFTANGDRTDQSWHYRVSGANQATVTAAGEEDHVGHDRRPRQRGSHPGVIRAQDDQLKVAEKTSIRWSLGKATALAAKSDVFPSETSGSGW
jgi:hypothetical protein